MAHPNRDGRERALELLYEAEAKGDHPVGVIAGLPLPPVPFALALATGVADHFDLLDHLLGARARGWTVERMAVVDRTLLRMGAYELAFEPDLPVGVAVSEAVELATLFCGDDAPRFVNGLLGAVAKDVRGEGPWGQVARPEALLVDMDGVVRHWEGGSLVTGDESLGLPAGTMAGVALDPDRVRRANDGTLTHDQWREEVAGLLAETHGVDPVAVLAAWLDDDAVLNDEVVTLLRSVREAGHPVVLVSNATTRLESDLADRGVADAFDAVVNSSTVGCCKPEPAIYAAAIEAAGAPAGSCLFVDDRPENVAAALTLGIPAVRFTSGARLAATLVRLHLVA